MKKIRSTREGSLITYVGPATLPDGRPADREKVTFWGTLAGDKSGVTDIDEKVLAEAIKDPIVRAWFEEGTLSEHIPLVMPKVTEAEPTAAVIPPSTAQKSAEPTAAESKGAKK
jgi:hypothetical protein